MTLCPTGTILLEMIIRDKNFKRLGKSVSPDAKRRVVIPGIVKTEGITYEIYANSMGQIMLDPQVTIPVSEAWLFNNPEALEAVRMGLDDAKKGRVSRVDMDEL